MKTSKKILNIVVILLGVILIVLCVDIVSNKISKTSYDELTELDRKAIGEVCEAISLFNVKRGNSDIWNENYNLREQGCLITDKNAMVRGCTYAVNVNPNDSVFSQKIEMPDEYGDIAVYRFSHLSPFSMSLDDSMSAMLNGREVLSFTYNTATVDINGAGSFEESYIKNTFNMAVQTPDAPSANIAVSFVADEENIALMGLQYRIIDDIMQCSKKAELNELLCEYVAVREYQSEMYPEFASQQERVELVEGREQYVFYKISGLTGKNMTYFNKESSDSITFFSAYHYLCTGHYNNDVSEFLDHMGSVYSGAALCEILDNNNISKRWENKLDNSTNYCMVSQYSLIKAYCDKNCGELDRKTVDDIKNSYSYEQILEMARALVEGNAE